MAPGIPSSLQQSQLLTLNLNNLQEMCDDVNRESCEAVNGALEVYENNHFPPPPTTINWQFFNPLMGAALYNAMNRAALLMQPNAFAKYDESAAIVTVPISIPPNTASISINPTTHFPQFSPVTLFVTPKAISDLVGPDSGDGIHYLTVPFDSSPNGYTVTDSRGTFTKVVQKSTVGTSAWWILAGK